MIRAQLYDFCLRDKFMRLNFDDQY